MSRLFSCLGTLLLVAIVPLSSQAAQQGGGPLWLNAAYTYNDITYKESAMEEKGRMGGVQGELGLRLFNTFAVSAGGQYMDGHLNYDGSTFAGDPIRTVTKDQIRDLRAMGHLYIGSVVLSAGMAQRYWYNDLVISYRRRTWYDYTPVMLTLFATNSIYLRFEHDIWRGGRNKSHMSDTSSSRKDVEFKQKSGSGMGGELGYIMPNANGISTRIFVSYHKWSVKASDVKNDGVDNLVEPENETITLQAGVGLSF